MDRLINESDQKWFKESLLKTLFLFFKVEYKQEELFESKPPLIWCDFMKRGVELSDRIYDEVKDY
jgi:dynein heavy chain